MVEIVLIVALGMLGIYAVVLGALFSIFASKPLKRVMLVIFAAATIYSILWLGS